MDGTIPVLRGQVDLLHAGPRSLAVEASTTHTHPVAHIQAHTHAHEWERRSFLLERVYGRAAAWEANMDRAILSSVRRLPGLPSSHVGLDTVMRRCTHIGFEDVLGQPHLRPDLPRYSVHEAVERRLLHTA